MNIRSRLETGWRKVARFFEPEWRKVVLFLFIGFLIGAFF